MYQLKLADISFVDGLIIQQLLVIYTGITNELDFSKDSLLCWVYPCSVFGRMGTLLEMSVTESPVSSSSMLTLLMWAREEIHYSGKK